jgi:hypothetical protein
MATQVEKAKCGVWFIQIRFAITVQRLHRNTYRKLTPTRKSIYAWRKQFVETDCLCKGKSPGRPRLADCTVEAENVKTSNLMQCAFFALIGGCLHIKLLLKGVPSLFTTVYNLMLNKHNITPKQELRSKNHVCFSRFQVRQYCNRELLDASSDSGGTYEYLNCYDITKSVGDGVAQSV